MAERTSGGADAREMKKWFLSLDFQSDDAQSIRFLILTSSHYCLMSIIP